MSAIIILYLLLSSSVAMTLFLWFKTNAFVEYASLLVVHNLWKLADYEEITRDDKSLSYPEFLAQYHSNFFVRLITCPNCLSVWLSSLINLVVFVILHFFFGFLIWLAFPASALATTYFALFLYYGLLKMMK